jgi:DNA-binding MarR family transcriptional regulator
LDWIERARPFCGYQGIEKGPHAPRQSVEDAILEAIPKSGQGYARVNATSIARACGVHQSTVSRALYRMVSDGVLEFAYPRRYRRSAVSRGSTLRRDDLALLLDLQDRVAALSERMDQVERTVNAGLERMDQSLHDLMALMRSVLDTAQPRFTETRTPRIDTEPTFAPAIETAAVNGDGSSASCLPDAEASIDQEPSHTDGVQESKRRARSTTSRTQVINLDDVSSMKGAVRFEEFWQEYPRHERKKDAVRHWISQKLDDKADQIIDDVRMRKAYSKAWNTGYAPHAATYLNGQRWTDSIDFLKPSDQCIVLANTLPVRRHTRQR